MRINPNNHPTAFAASHSDDAHIEHCIQEIMEHAIWHQVGHVMHLGGFALGILGGLLSSRSLGEEDCFYIQRPISKPTMIKCRNPRTGMLDDCLRLENGREIVGQDIIKFYKDLQSAQIVKNLEKGQRGL